MFRHPKYYKELRKRNNSDQAISTDRSRDKSSVTPIERAPGPGLKLQAATHDLAEATGRKQQASSSKHQATSKPEPSSDSEISSSKLQASSYKRQA